MRIAREDGEIVLPNTPLHVYTCTSFAGHWPVGTAAVIIASNRPNAAKLLQKTLEKMGLKQQVEEEDLKYLRLDRAQAIVLRDGDY